MTPKTLISIDLKELAAIEIRCSSCGGMLTIPVVKESVNPSQSCPGCNTLLWGIGDSGIFNTLRDLTLALSFWQRTEEKRFALGFSLPMPPRP